MEFKLNKQQLQELLKKPAMNKLKQDLENENAKKHSNNTMSMTTRGMTPMTGMTRGISQ
jgi:hypothetical protein